jgi:hypothetical protein
MKDARLGQIGLFTTVSRPHREFGLLGRCLFSLLPTTAVPAWVGFAAMTGSSRKKTNAGAVPTAGRRAAALGDGYQP